MSLDQRKSRRETRTRTDPESDQESTPDLDPAPSPVAIDTHHEDAILAIMFGGIALGCGGIALILWMVPLAVGTPPASVTLSISLATLARGLGAGGALLLCLAFGTLAIMGGVVYASTASVGDME